MTNPTVSEIVTGGTLEGGVYTVPDTGTITLSGTISDPSLGVTIKQSYSGTLKTLGTATVDASGNWTFAIPTPSDGTYTFTAFDTGTVYHSSPATVTVTGNTIVSLLTDTGSSHTDGITNDASLEIIAASNATGVEVYDSLGDDLGAATLQSSGTVTTWTFLDTISPDGAVTYDALATLLVSAGPPPVDTISQSNSLSITLETTPPPTPTLSLADLTGTTATSVATLKGTAGANLVVTIYENGTLSADAIGTTVADGSGNWTFTPTSAAASENGGTNTYYAADTDIAGNVATSGSIAVTFEASIAAPTITLDDLTGTTATNDKTLDISAASSAETVAVSDNSGFLGDAVHVSGTLWDYVPTLGDGTYNFTAVVTDGAGNTATSSTLTATFKSSAPTGTVAFTEGSITQGNAQAVGYTVGSLDTSGDTAVVTFLDSHTGLSITQTVTADGTYTVNLGGLGHASDGTVTVDASIAVTDAANNHSNSSPAATIDGVICFYPGTLIRTPSGERAVETLDIGDLVLTEDGSAEPIRWIGRQKVSTRFADPLRVLPIRVRQGALGDNLPVRDLLISADHAIAVDGILIQAGALVNGTSIIRERDVPEVFTYYHIELANHELILAEGQKVETFVDNVDRWAFDNWAEHEALYGHLPEMVELDRPRAQSRRQVPQAIRARIDARAAAIAQAA